MAPSLTEPPDRIDVVLDHHQARVKVPYRPLPTDHPLWVVTMATFVLFAGIDPGFLAKFLPEGWVGVVRYAVFGVLGLVLLADLPTLVRHFWRGPLMSIDLVPGAIVLGDGEIATSTVHDIETSDEGLTLHITTHGEPVRWVLPVCETAEQRRWLADVLREHIRQPSEPIPDPPEAIHEMMRRAAGRALDRE